MNLLKAAFYCFSAVFLFSSPLLQAQQIRYDQIDFMNNPPWGDVLERSVRTGKVIFVDGYTSWCAPCKKMDKEVFTRPEIANYFNQKFINVKYDMEFDQGDELKRKYGVKVFPTYLFISPEGQEIHRIVGAHIEGNEFLDWSKMAVTSGQNYAELERRYRNGERNPAMMFDYMRALRMAGEKEKEVQITQNYLALMTKDHFMDRSYWGAVKLFLNDPTSREFRIIMDNREEIGEVIGLGEVDDKIYQTIDGQIKSDRWFISRDGHLFDHKAAQALIEILQKANIPKRNELLARTKAVQYIRNGDIYELVYMVDAIIDFRILEGYENFNDDLNFYAVSVSKAALDDKLLHKALSWTEYACKRENRTAERAVFLNTKAMLLEKLGRNTEAASARKEAADAEKL
ncbi:MAG: thioredoxin fold domain-containing protein [Saprospiraceae bacterium]|nr:thioredoxin fold domain-containing protein [Saprospiraceae bacterium]MCF8249063.1 thioredoxin fold domain-containing protein [Saprospiraceae bacterium]MCF8280930.1 thioredoxin fold domain-containing protein [Bacteroidales bacterium]MCF8311085.1 thioredoxin fold domain-containing protein [Saprospiraceae bacterium]MCF8440175.1 thioredoxin fold domain-containing protein [Saprospiraceae bacterium]